MKTIIATFALLLCSAPTLAAESASVSPTPKEVARLVDFCKSGKVDEWLGKIADLQNDLKVAENNPYTLWITTQPAELLSDNDRIVLKNLERNRSTLNQMSTTYSAFKKDCSLLLLLRSVPE